MPRLKLVVSNETPYGKRWQGHDPVFIQRDQLSIGTTLTYFGRLNHGMQWKVTEIYSVRDSGRRKFHTSVTRLSDVIMLQRVGSNETRPVGFMYLSYSAIWRIAE